MFLSSSGQFSLIFVSYFIYQYGRRNGSSAKISQEIQENITQKTQNFPRMILPLGEKKLQTIEYLTSYKDRTLFNTVLEKTFHGSSFMILAKIYTQFYG